MSQQRVIGLALVVAGVILLYFGLHATDSVGETVKENVTSSYTDRTTWYIIGGVAASIVGLGITFIGGRGAQRAT